MMRYTLLAKDEEVEKHPVEILHRFYADTCEDVVFNMVYFLQGISFNKAVVARNLRIIANDIDPPTKKGKTKK